MTTKTYSLVGAGIGATMFLAVGLLPSILYGGYAGLMLASGIAGTPVQPTLLVKSLIVFGMVLGVAGIAALFTVFGAVIGSAFGVLIEKKDGVVSPVLDTHRE
jgi:hypothetical protein